MTKAHILADNNDYWTGMTETVQYYPDYIYDGATFSFWCKRSDIGTGKEMYIYYGTHDHIVTSMKFSDPNAWYHIHLYINAEESVASNRFKLTVNGQLITEYDPASNSAMSDQTSIPIPAGFWDAPAISGDNYYQAGGNIGIGGPSNILGRSYNSTTNNKEFKGILSHFYYDSKEHAASNFGEVDSTTGIWKFKPYSPTWSEHGFYILKDDNGFTDQSGKSPGYITTVTITGSVTDTLDCPSNVFATGNPIGQYRTQAGYPTFSNGNNTIYYDNGTYNEQVSSTLSLTGGNFYWETKIESGIQDSYIGIYKSDDYTNGWVQDNVHYLYLQNGTKRNGNTSSSYGNSYTNGDIIGCAWNGTTGTIWFSKNGTWQNSATITEIANGTTTNSAFTGLSSATDGSAWLTFNSDYNNGKHSLNFGNGYFGTTAVSSAGINASGNGIFEYDVPTGFTALSTKGLNL